MNDILAKITIFICLLIATYSLGFADTVYLKSGQSVEGKIIEKTDKYVKIDFQGIVLTYYIDEIDRISEETSKSTPQTTDANNIVGGDTGLQKESVDSTSKIISKLRGLEFKNPVNYGITTKAEIKKLYLTALEKKQKRLKEEEKILKKLGLLPSYVDYYGLIVNVMPQEIGGYYNPDEKKLFIVDSIPKEEWDGIVAHEIYHALQDQYFDLNLFLERNKEVDINSDRYIARNAVVEGEACAIMIDYKMRDKNIKFTSLPNLAASTDIFRESIKSMYPGLSSAPNFLAETMLFTYLQGLSFLGEVRVRHVWEWVSNLYKDPPNSSEQIIHPEKYLQKREEPILVRLPELSHISGKSLQRIYEDTLGEFVTKCLIKQFSDLPTASLASEGWGGDRIGLFEDSIDKKSFLVYLSTWDSRQDAEEFFWAYHEVIKNKYLKAKSVNSAESNLRLWDTEDGKVSLEIRGCDVLIIDGAETDELLKSLRVCVWKQRPATEDKSVSRNVLDAAHFYEKGKQLAAYYQGDTMVLSQANIFLMKALQLDDKYLPAYIAIGENMLRDAYIQGEEYDEKLVEKVMDLIEKVRAIDPHYSALHNLMGRVYFALRRYDESARELESAVEFVPDRDDNYFWLSKAYNMQKQYVKALQTINRAITLNPGSYFNYNQLGFILYDSGEYEKAAEAFRKSVEINPNFAWGWNNYSLPLYELHKYDEAIEACKNAIKIMDFGMAHSNLGRAYMGKGLYGEAEKEFRSINDLERLNELAQILRLQGKAGKSKELISDIIKEDIQNTWAYMQKGLHYADQGDLDKALEQYKIALDIDPNYAPAYVNMANVYDQKGNVDKALEYYNKAYALDDNNATVRFNLGWLYFKRRDYDAAISYFQEALKLRPNHAATYHGLGRSYQEKGDTQNAVLNFKEYLRLDPNGEFVGLVRQYLRSAGADPR